MNAQSKTDIGFRNTLFLIFAMSGFSGLIYESIWTHYLKLFLGHAAFAQTLVLVIFMGGMAIGSWLASRNSVNWKNPFLAYAIIEAIIGVFAILFQTVFVESTAFSYNVILPALGSETGAAIYKWTLAALLILPQSILLGTTFPLMSSGIIRQFPQQSGFSLSMLYFTNSLGAALGVLVSGFILIDAIGLPGTILFAGFLNILLALAVWLRTRDLAPQYIAEDKPSGEQSTQGFDSRHLLILIAALTGAASFMYEVGWIRMLSLVLGSSTHAFEMMLSAFILGLAFGGFWIRKRIDHIKNPMMFLGVVQIVMGFFALMTIPVYNSTFDLMGYTIEALSKTMPGYALFNFISHFITLIIMIPATFCAGMTLPLITNILIQKGGGEKSIGKVYAANTAGAIIGVVFAVNIGFPFLALKGLLSFGVLIDIIAGITLIYYANKTRAMKPVFITTASSLGVVLLVAGLFDFDTVKMSSGVYRYGSVFINSQAEMLYHKDGKTTTVSMVKYNDSLSIRTNGKPDAAISLPGATAPSEDEPTMILAALIPLTIMPEAQQVANIGMGSGLTGHALLASPVVKNVDTIEIEPLIAEAAEMFGSKVERTFTDPRSNIYFDDAKSFFTTHQKKYDIIISEPSNPWVSGISSLFTKEWYELVRNHITEKGVYAQWLHLYESNINIVASVLKALSPSFEDYAVYSITKNDILIVASNTTLPSQLDPKIFLHKDIRAISSEIGISGIEDIQLMHLGNKSSLDYPISNIPSPVNSDYYPFLDLNAVRARYLETNAYDLITLRDNPLPMLEMLNNNHNNKNQVTSEAKYIYSKVGINKMKAVKLRDMVLKELPYTDASLKRLVKQEMYAQILLLTSSENDCRKPDPDLLFNALFNYANAVIPYLKVAELDAIWKKMDTSSCFKKLQKSHQGWARLLFAISNRDAGEISRISTNALMNLKSSGNFRLRNLDYLVASAMLGNLANKTPEKAFEIWQEFIPYISDKSQLSFIITYMAALSIKDAENNLHQQPTASR